MDTEAVALNLWWHWSKCVCDLLGEEWGEDDTEITMAVLSLFQAGKTPGEAAAQIRRGLSILVAAVAADNVEGVRNER